MCILNHITFVYGEIVCDGSVIGVLFVLLLMLLSLWNKNLNTSFI